MENKPFLFGVFLALAVAAMFFAYRAGQHSATGEFEDGMRRDLEALRIEYDETVAELRDEFDKRAQKLEDRLYTLREELAQSGVRVSPLGVQRDAPPAPRETGASASPPPSAPGEDMISRDTYNQIRNNMSKADVERIIGRPGTSLGGISSNGKMNETFRWTWTNLDGTEGKLTCEFEDDRLRYADYRP